jgi:hypothetical protein
MTSLLLVRDFRSLQRHAFRGSSFDLPGWEAVLNSEFAVSFKRKPETQLEYSICAVSQTVDFTIKKKVLKVYTGISMDCFVFCEYSLTNSSSFWELLKENISFF